MDQSSIQEALELAAVVREPQHFDELDEALDIWIERLQSGEVGPAEGETVAETMKRCRTSQEEIRLAEEI
jgi:hypothetical protein